MTTGSSMGGELRPPPPTPHSSLVLFPWLTIVFSTFSNRHNKIPFPRTQTPSSYTPTASLWA